MNSTLRIFLTGLFAAILTSCAGYQLGGAKPPSLAAVRKISVPMFANGTLHPRAEALATSAVAAALVRDGTYRLVTTDQADAVLEGRLSSIKYSTLRGSRLDTLLAEEFTNEVILVWELKDARDPTRILASGKSRGNSSLFVDANLQTSRHNALPDAMERAGGNLVSTLASGY